MSIAMPSEKPKYGFIGSFQKGGSNLIGILGSWGKYGVIEVYEDRLAIRKGLFWTKLVEEIYFRDIISFRMESLSTLGPVGLVPWIELAYKDSGKTKKLEFTSNTHGAVELIRQELEKHVKKRK